MLPLTSSARWGGASSTLELESARFQKFNLNEDENAFNLNLVSELASHYIAGSSPGAMPPDELEFYTHSLCPYGSDVQPALVIGRHYITEYDSAPVQYNGIV